MLSAFETLPLEIRNMILEYCFVCNREVIPFPTQYEREERRVTANTGLPVEGTLPILGKQLKWRQGSSLLRDTKYSQELSSVVLLGVNKKIKCEAASILFGRNVWRLSYHGEGDLAGELFLYYQRDMRHVACKFDIRDVSTKELMRISQRHMLKASNHEATSGSRIYCPTDADLKAIIHNERLKRMTSSWTRRCRTMAGMSLESVVFDIGNLYCPSGCCREEVIEQFSSFMAMFRPWLRRETTSWREWKHKTDFRVVGFLNENERAVVRQGCGFEFT